MDTNGITRSDLGAAADLVYAHMLPTPQYVWPRLCEQIGHEVWVKHENVTPIGAFKVRGGLVYLNDRMAPGKNRPKCLVTATRGNHGQSVPFAARAYGVPVTVVVPEGNSAAKNAAMAAWGAQLVEYGADFDSAMAHAQDLAAQPGHEYVSSFHPLLVQGVATYVYELLQVVPTLARLYVPIGMGSGICAAIAVRDLLGTTTEIVGVVAQGADAMAASFESGRMQPTNRAETFADGMAVRSVHPAAFAIISKGAARVVRVSDDEIAAALRLLFACTGHVAEGAGAAALAALRQESAAAVKHQGAASLHGPSGVVVSGGNIDAQPLAQLLAGATPKP